MAENNQNNWDVIVVGAGAAGLMAAIHAARSKLRVLLLDGQPKVGAKILMSGGTRCNVTNVLVSEKDYVTGCPRALRNILRSYTSRQTIDFFEKLDVKFVIEEGGKYFPSTHSGKTILDALIKEVRRLKIDLFFPHRVKDIKYEENYFNISGNGFSYNAPYVILTTGGLSYPQTGSDGGGYLLSKKFGHTLLETSPALTPFITDEKLWCALKGISLNCSLTLFVNGKKDIEFRGPILFTHFGFSGPTVLNMSRYWYEGRKSGRVEIAVDFLPGLGKDIARELLSARGSLDKSIKKILAAYLPERFVQSVLKRVNVDEKKKLDQLSKAEAKKIALMLHQYVLPVKDVYGYQKAEVTAGGIDLNEVDSKTLESKLRPGLFFSGEILDVDGRIGGFNFQWAFSSAVAAARGISQKIKKNSKRSVPAQGLEE